MTPDVNVLVAASRSDHPHHAVAHGWLRQAAADAAFGRGLTLMPMVTAGFLRIVTSPKIFREPTPVAAAVAFIESLLAAPGVRMATIGGEWPRLAATCLERDLSGNDVSDAWLAAAATSVGEHVVSFDHGFRKLLGRSGWTLLRPAVA